MNCSQCRDEISRAHLAQEGLPASLRSHIEECQDCRQTLEKSDRLESSLRSRKEIHTASPDLHRRIMDELKHKKGQRTPVRLRPIYAAIAASLLLAIGATIPFDQLRSQKTAQSTSSDDPISRILAAEQNPEMLLVSASQAMSEAIDQEVQLFQDDLKRAARFCGGMLSMNSE